MTDLIIVGIGNPYRGDDGAGWAVIDGLNERIGSQIKLVKIQSDIAELIDLFSKYQIVYLVDAFLGDEGIKMWHRIDVHHQTIPNEVPQTSSHGFSASQAISIAKNLDQLPGKLILYAIRGNRYQIGDALSREVEDAVEQVIIALLKEEDVQSCMNIA